MVLRDVINDVCRQWAAACVRRPVDGSPGGSASGPHGVHVSSFVLRQSTPVIRLLERTTRASLLTSLAFDPTQKREVFPLRYIGAKT